MLTTYHCTDGMFGFRIGKFGLTIKDTRKHSLLFSERYGYTKLLKVGPYVIKIWPWSRT